MSGAGPAVLERLRGFLDDWGRPYALIGGLAIVARVRVRTTDDADVMLVVRPGETRDLIARARAHGYRFDEQNLDLAEGGLVRLAGVPSEDGRLDLDLIYDDEPFVADVIARATEVDLAGVTLRVATSEDLLLMKLDANRGQDLDDAIAIKDAFGDRLDRAYLDRQARALDIEARLRALLDHDD